MAEPVIGMKFGSYQSMTNELGRSGLVKEKNGYMENYAGKHKYEWKGSYNPLAQDYDTTDKMTYISDSKHVGVYASKNFDKENHLVFTGVTHNYQKFATRDIKYTRIIGEEYYAIDKNGNGKVDEGEIQKIEKGVKRLKCYNAENDEQTYHINASI